MWMRKKGWLSLSHWLLCHLSSFSPALVSSYRARSMFHFRTGPFTFNGQQFTCFIYYICSREQCHIRRISIRNVSCHLHSTFLLVYALFVLYGLDSFSVVCQTFSIFYRKCSYVSLRSKTFGLWQWRLFVCAHPNLMLFGLRGRQRQHKYACSAYVCSW